MREEMCPAAVADLRSWVVCLAGCGNGFDLPHHSTHEGPVVAGKSDTTPEREREREEGRASNARARERVLEGKRGGQGGRAHV